MIENAKITRRFGFARHFGVFNAMAGDLRETYPNRGLRDQRINVVL